jgi:hypothetical protein
MSEITADDKVYRTVPLVGEMVRNVPFDAHANNLFEEKRSVEDAPRPYETKAFGYVLDLMKDPDVDLVVLTGDAGHGKTHLCRRLLEESGLSASEALDYMIEYKRGDEAITVGPGRKPIRIIKDLSEFTPTEGAELLVSQLDDESTIGIVCANEGRLRSVVSENQERLGPLLETLQAGLDSGRTTLDGKTHIINLNYQSVTPRDGGFLEHIVKAWTQDGRRWRSCTGCHAREHCPIYRNKEMFGGSDDDSRSLRDGLEHLVRSAEQTGYVLTIRETLIFVAYLITGGVGCERVHEEHERGDFDALEARQFERLLFERVLSHYESEQLGVLERIRRYDPGVIPHRDVDERIVMELEDTGALGSAVWFGNDEAAQYTRSGRRKDALALRERVRTKRRESYFLDPNPGDDGIFDRSRRLGLHHYEDFDHIQGDDESPAAMRLIVERVVKGLHVVQGIRPQDNQSLFLVDPAFARAGSSASIIARRIPKRKLWLFGLHEFWEKKDEEGKADLMNAVDWVDRIAVLCDQTKGNEPIVELDLLQFEFVMRAADGAFFPNFHDSGRRRILTRLARVAENGSSEDEEIRAVVNDQIRTIVVERDKTIEINGGR